MPKPKAKTKKKNAADATLRNVRHGNKQLRQLTEAISVLTKRVETLELAAVSKREA